VGIVVSDYMKDLTQVGFHIDRLDEPKRRALLRGVFLLHLGFPEPLGTINDEVLPSHMFNFGKPKTAGDWIVHVAGALISLFLIWWILHYLLGL